MGFHQMAVMCLGRRVCDTSGGEWLAHNGSNTAEPTARVTAGSSWRRLAVPANAMDGDTTFVPYTHVRRCILRYPQSLVSDG